MPWGQRLISAGLIVMTLVLGGNWEWLGNLDFENNLQLTRGSLEYKKTAEEFCSLKRKFQEGVEKGGLSVKEMLKIAWRIDELNIKLGLILSHAESISGFDSLMRKKFIERWQPGPNFPREVRDETERQLIARQVYDQECNEACAERDGPNGAIGKTYGDDWFGKAVWWLAKTSFKWYWLMTLPLLLIVLLDIVYSGKKLREELTLRPLVFLKATACGPIGFLVMDNAPGKAYCFNKLEREYLSNKPCDYRLSEAERQALLRQVDEPLLAFNEALDAFLASGQLLRQPAMVCAMVWVMGIVFSFQIKGNADLYRPTTIASSAESGLAEVEAKKEVVAPAEKKSSPSQKEKYKLIALIIAPANELSAPKGDEERLQEIVQPIQRCCWKPDKSRGPPRMLVREQHTSATLCPSELATVMEG